MSVDVQFNGHKDADYEAGKPRHNARHARTPLARMQQHAVFEQKLREAEIEVALQARVRDAVLSFKATRR
jgi:hypothetical protein